MVLPVCSCSRQAMFFFFLLTFPLHKIAYINIKLYLCPNSNLLFLRINGEKSIVCKRNETMCGDGDNPPNF
jgi:hypothetical protein